MREPTDDPRSRRRRRLLAPAFRSLRLPYRQVVGLAALAFVSGLATATALVLLIQVALRVTDSADTGADVLGIDFAHHGLGPLFAAAVVAAVTVLLADLLAARQNARIISIVQLRLRTALFDAYGDADWVTQTADPPGHRRCPPCNEISR